MSRSGVQIPEAAPLHRQSHRKLTPLSLGTLKRHLATKVIDDCPTYIQTQARAIGIDFSNVATTEEFLEDAFLVCHGNTKAVIADNNIHVTFLRRKPDSNRLLIAIVFQCVREKILENDPQ